jgi:hypothetical protein
MPQARCEPIYRILTEKLTLPVLFGEAWERFPVKVHMTLVNRRSYPAGAPPPPETGVYVNEAPPLLEYLVITVSPVVPTAADAVPILKSVFAGMASLITIVLARELPEFVN